MCFRFFFWYAIVLGWMTSLLGADVAVYAGPNPPFNFRDKGIVQGLGFDLLEATLVSLRPRFKQEEIKLDVWGKAYTQALAHPTSFLISTARLEEREPLFQWVGSLCTVRLGVITKRKKELVESTNMLEILQPLRIATIKETAAEKVLFKALGEHPTIKIIRLSTPLQGYKMLENDHIDALVYTDVPFVYYLVQEGQDVNQYKMAHVLLNTDYYIAAGKEIPNEQIQIMQAQLNRLKLPDENGNSLYERIVARYLKESVLQP